MLLLEHVYCKERIQSLSYESFVMIAIGEMSKGHQRRYGEMGSMINLPTECYIILYSKLKFIYLDMIH